MTTTKTKKTMKRTLACGAALLLAALSSSAQLATAFTYQGRLNDTNGPLDGTFDFVFTLLDSANYPIGPKLTNAAVTVTEGCFTRALDFGENSFKRVRIAVPPFDFRWEGPGEWLEIAVRETASQGQHPAAFVTLAPRQHLSPAPYAAALTTPLTSSALDGIYSSEVYFSNVSNRFRGAFLGDAAGLSNVPASTMTGTLPTSLLGTNVALRPGGNAFSGNQTVMSGDVGIGTLSPEAKLDVRTTIISQGGAGSSDNLVFKKQGALGTANAQMVLSHRNGGRELWLYGYEPINGIRNLQGWHYGSNAVSFPAGGQTLYIDEGFGRVGVGRRPVAEKLEVDGNVAVFGTILGDRLNIGEDNVVNSDHATVAGGRYNTNSAGYSTIGGGINNYLRSSYGTIGGGRNNTIPLGMEYGTVGGGYQNTAAGDYATVSGGRNNHTGSGASAVVGGQDNVADGSWATIAGGYSGQASGNYSIVLGGTHNVSQGNNSLAAGSFATAAHNNSFIWNGETSLERSTTGDRRFEVYAPGGAFFTTGTASLYASGDMSCGTLTIRGGADLAEPFAVSGDNIPAGAVVVIDEQHPGRLKLSTAAYDHKVAGIVSGAGGVQPGISMLQTEKLEGGRNVALSGRVFALVDATKHPVQPGDLLTTSETPGHAMKAVNPAQAQGAILGKAMTPLPSGRGLVLVLVSLQ
ncbi:MAG: hypothetical protein HZA90_21560 [Verrucomicrobia bacterium]|nr:hypothetical protein [Verrucomicrobiota bacterium]